MEFDFNKAEVLTKIVPVASEFNFVEPDARGTSEMQAQCTLVPWLTPMKKKSGRIRGVGVNNGKPSLILASFLFLFWSQSNSFWMINKLNL